jgi:hypothetical protein
MMLAYAFVLPVATLFVMALPDHRTFSSPLGASSSSQGAPAEQMSIDDATSRCPRTEPNGRTFGEGDASRNFGNASLGTFLPAAGAVITKDRPDRSTLSVKWGWWRLVHGELQISGRRLDADAPPMEALIPQGYGPIGFQSSRLIFPSTGCWSITGDLGGATLTFVTRVTLEQ